MADDPTVPVVTAAGEHLAAGALKTTKADPGKIVVGGVSGSEVTVITDDMAAGSAPIPCTNTTGITLAGGQRVEVTHFPDGRVTVSGLLGGGNSALGTYRDSAWNIPAAGEVLAIGGTISGTTYPQWAAQCAATGFPYGGNLANPGIPNVSGRGRIGQGTGAGLTNRVAGTDYGAETHLLTEAELPYDFQDKADLGPGGTGRFTRFLGSGVAFNILDPVKACYVFVQVA